MPQPRAILLAALLLAAPALGAPPVTVSHEPLTLPSLTSTPRYKENPNVNGANFHGPYADPVPRTLQTLWLENNLLKVQIIPELGGPVARAIHKPSNHDVFFFEGKLKDGIPFWESGVKVSFPWHEHAVRTTDQPAATRIVNHPDGSTSVAMFMEFSRFHEHWNRHMFGRHSNLLLTQTITLRPNDARLHIRYRVTNPAPYRQGLNIWNDAFFPRQHTPKGIVQQDHQPFPETDTEWIFPAAFVSHHLANQARPYSEADTRVAAYKDEHQSIFAWAIQYPFTGVYYPSVQVNRLRITDPAVAPGAKQYFVGEGRYAPGKVTSHMYNYLELWGGASSVFEGVEQWIEPGQSVELPYAYILLAGMPKTHYATTHAAVHADFTTHTLHAATFTPQTITASLDGTPLGDPVQTTPGTPVTFPLPKSATAGRITLRNHTTTLLDATLPLAPAITPEDKTRIKSANEPTPQASEMIGSAFCYGRHLREAANRYPKNTTPKGRAQYRDGQLDNAINTLTAAATADPADGEAQLLLALAHWEKDNLPAARPLIAAAVKNNHTPAAYYAALLALADKDTPKALALLTNDQGHPIHHEARLLSAALLTTTTEKPLPDSLNQELAALDTLDPADPRLQWIRAQANLPGAQEALTALLKEPGAQKRIDEFTAALQGQYTHPRRMDPPPPPQKPRK